MDICGHDDLFYFAFPISAALGFKIPSNAVLRAKSLPISALDAQSYCVICKNLAAIFCKL